MVLLVEEEVVKELLSSFKIAGWVGEKKTKVVVSVRVWEVGCRLGRWLSRGSWG